MLQNFGEECEQSKQCQHYLLNSECIKGKCECKQGYHLVNKKYFRNVNLNENCLTLAECCITEYNSKEVECNKTICRYNGGKCRFVSCLKDFCNCDYQQHLLIKYSNNKQMFYINISLFILSGLVIKIKCFVNHNLLNNNFFFIFYN